MSRGVLKISVFSSFVHSSSGKPFSCLYKVFSRLMTTGNHLDGLENWGVDFPRTGCPQSEKSPAKSVSAQEFSFLRDSLLDTDALSSPTVKGFDSGKCSNESLLIVNAIKTNKDGLGGKTQKFLRQFREKLNERLVVDVLKNVQNPELGMKFFMWAGRQIGYSHSLPVYDALLDLLVSNKNNRIHENFLQEIKDDDREVLGKLLNVFIRKCCRNGLWNLALEELGRLKDFGYRPSTVTYNALVQVFLEVDKLDTAALVQREMSDLGFKMDMHTLGCFVRSLCKEGKWREALDLIEKEEFVPDTVIYTNMIAGLCEASLFEEAMEFLNRMRCNSCIPNVVTYETMLCACLNKKKLGRCKGILNMMITEGCFPHPKLFNSLVHAYCRSGDYSFAYKLLKRMVYCGYQPGYVVYNILIGDICGNEFQSLDMLEIAEKAYDEMLEQGVILNKVNICNFARCLCGHGKFEKAFNVIHEMMGKGFVPDICTYSKVIGYLCNASKLEKAFLLFQELKRNGIVPDVYTYTILIDNFCKAGLIQQAQIWFNEMLRDGCTPNVVTYTALIHTYLKARKISEANNLFELMLSEGCIPNVVTFTALIDGHCKAGDVEKACQIYARMMGNKNIPDVDMYFKTDDESYKKLNVVTYGALVDGLCKKHKVKEACNLLEIMAIEGCEPNHIVYDSLIDGFCKAGKVDEAQEIYTQMLERGFNPSLYTYSSFLDRLFKDKRLDLAIKVLSKMLEDSCAPNVIIYTQMIDGLCKVGKIDEAYKLMLMMEEKGCLPNVVTYTAMIDGFGKAARFETCNEIFQKMGTKGCAPNNITYAVLIKHYTAAGLLDEACVLLDDMRKTHWPIHMTSYCKVIEGFNKEFIVSLGLFDEIGDSDSLPIVNVYKLLIDSFYKAGKLERSFELLKELSTTSVSVFTLTNMYSSLIEGFSCSHKIDKAFELYADMVNKGLFPELGAFANLIKGLIRVNKWESALQLSESVCNMAIDWRPSENTSKEN
ncbi:hypothetical protein M9H77_26804 [Catharanthus roseus]|uniref:Uncharacterized protein n=1 Tax=Catharanthus roseus TaxID=4058 RepID=A0ACC0ABQ1_CATRO|nr:hypothetical protein M9H77_26804 [Catharanthus roseus]